MTFRDRKVQFNAVCVCIPGWGNYAELLIDPIDRRFAIRPATEKDCCAVKISKFSKGACQSRTAGAAAFSDTLFTLLGWKLGYRYRIAGALYQNSEKTVCIFNAGNAEILLRPDCLPQKTRHLLTAGNRVREIPETWSINFGQPYYLHGYVSGSTLEDIKSSQRTIETGRALRVTSGDDLRRYLEQELSSLLREEEANG